MENDQSPAAAPPESTETARRPNESPLDTNVHGGQFDPEDVRLVTRKIVAMARKLHRERHDRRTISSRDIRTIIEYHIDKV